MRAADAFGLPLVQSSMSQGQDFSKGANIAFVAATALDLAYILQENVTSVPPLNSFLSVQLGWFEQQQLKPSLCNATKDYDDYLGRSLFFVGEFGGNDYTFLLAANKTVDQAKTYVPAVVNAIADGVERLIKHGARRIVVPGILPTGCIPVMLTLYASPERSDYDLYGCLNKYNGLSRYHDELLRSQIEALRKKSTRFDGSSTLLACCGAGGEYNYNPIAACGFPGATACADPSRAVNWDGIHLTEAAYRVIAGTWLHSYLSNFKRLLVLPPILLRKKD
uniref:Uncharacterized protein n=1 Tax=Setaria viridis TaxID=4556 RepID=A0A4U6UGW1_SETVI|nr:hypothetical protein SEVIR_5G149700v2 [Setaria viridis]